MTRAGQVVLRARHLARTFPGPTPTVALRDASVDLVTGEFVAVMGASGSGKTTLLNLLGLLDRPSAGSLEVAGIDAASLTDTRRTALRADAIAPVFQDSILVLEETALWNAALGLRCAGVPFQDRESRAMGALNSVGLDSLRSRPAATLSGGERQRAALARALAGDARVVLADEPTGNLDQANTEGVVRLLREIADSGRALMVVTHDPAVAAAADRVLTMTDGALASEGPGNPGLREGVGDSASGCAVLENRVWRRSALLDDLADAAGSITAHLGKNLLIVLAFALGLGGLVGATGLASSAAAQVSQRLTVASLDQAEVDLQGSQALPATASAMAGRARTLRGVHWAGIVVACAAEESRVTRFGPLLDPWKPGMGVATHGADDDFLASSETVVNPSSAAALFNDGQTARIALVSQSAAQRLGLPESAMGQTIWVLGARYTVVGMIASSGREPSLAEGVVVPVNAALLSASAKARLVVRTDVGGAYGLAQALPLALDPVNPSSVRVGPVPDLANLRRGVSDDLSLVVLVTSILLMVVSTISAGVSLYVSVVGRSKHIALRKALGMTRLGIARMFLSEGILLGLLGALAGVALGLAFVAAVCAARGWTAVLPWWTPSVVLGVGLLTGALAAVVPATVAARLDPAALLRSL